MATRSQKVRLTVFLLAAFVLLTTAVGVLAGLKLWDRKNTYYVLFRESVSGLEVGSVVRMRGVHVGQVSRIAVENSEIIRVDLALEPDVPVKKDTHAVLSSLGITGLKFVELTGSSTKSPLLLPNTRYSRIPSSTSTLQALTGKATDIAAKLEALLDQLTLLTDVPNRERVSRALDSADRLMDAWAKMAESNERHVTSTLNSVDKAAANLANALVGINQLIGQASPGVLEAIAAAGGAAKALQKTVRELDLQEIPRAATALRRRLEGPDLTHATASVRAAATNIERAAAQLVLVVQQRDRQLAKILTDVEGAAESVKGFARAIRERPSLLLQGQVLKERKLP